ncbi:MAG: alpha/beta hydrolase [Kitasatospora sp.]|jgi:pimeloyl-ACP methyl ester carboxylesterase|nr:alpha/beta hydrolase [Kitasatospora sp.]
MQITRPLLSAALNGTSRISARSAGRAAFALFCYTGPRIPVRPAEQPVMDAAWPGALTVNGKHVATYCWGDGENPVLLVHGWQFRAARWAPVITALRDAGYTPVAFDAPGPGASAGRETNILEYREVMRQLGEEYGRFDAVIGHSFGALAAVFALRGAIRADAVVSISGVADFGFLAKGFTYGLGLNARVGAELRRRLGEFLAARDTGSPDRYSATHRPEEIDTPLLLVHDEQDAVVGRDQADAMLAAYGDRARLLLTRGLGHRRILADPDVVAATLGFVSAAELRR